MEQQQPQSRTQAQQFIDALHALEQGDREDADSLAALFADDARLTNAALKLTGEERRGREAILHFWSEYKRTVGMAYSEFHQVTASDGAAGLFWTTKGTGPDGQAIQYDGSTLLVFDTSGKISAFEGYYDTRQLNREMGAER